MTTISLRGRPGGFSTSTSRPNFIGRVKRVWQYRRILNLLVRRDLKVRYAGSALGYLWTVLDPLLMTLIFWFVFTQIFKRSIGYDPYILFLVSGQVMWTWFNGGVNAASRALRSQAQMVRSTNVPRELWVLRTVLSKGIEYIFSLPVIAIFAIAYLKGPHVELLLLPLAMVMCFFLTLGVGLLLAPLTVLVRDIDRVIPIFLRLLYYGSPVLYSVKNIPPHLGFIYDYDPTVGMLVLSRSVFFPQELAGMVPLVKNGAQVKHHGKVVMHYVNHWDFVWHSAIGIAIIFAIGVFVFTRLERPVLKEI